MSTYRGCGQPARPNQQRRPRDARPLWFLDADRLEGNCWTVPGDVDPGRAVLTTVPVEEFSWWSISPADGDAWCVCGECPTVPAEHLGHDLYGSCDGRVVAHYAARVLTGDKFPPIQVLHDPAGQDWCGPRTFLVDDGMHRVSAYRLAGRARIEACVYAADHAAAIGAFSRA